MAHLMGKRTKGPSKIDHSIYETHITFSEYRWIINGGSNSFHSLKAPVSTDEDAALQSIVCTCNDV